MTPSWRKPVGVIGILAYLTAWVVGIASFADHTARLPVLVQLLLYLVAGIAWILPLKPALRWMETGVWRGF